jgi:hypothetical protein
MAGTSLDKPAMTPCPAGNRAAGRLTSGKRVQKQTLGLLAESHSCCVDRFRERSMDDRVLVLGLLCACLVNVACLCGYL